MRSPIFSSPERYTPSPSVPSEYYTPPQHPTNDVIPSPRPCTHALFEDLPPTPPGPYTITKQVTDLANGELDTIELIVGSEDSPTGIYKIIVNRPYIIAISQRWAEIIRRNGVRRSHWFTGGNSHTVVVLPEDDAQMMHLLLLIAHFRMELVPPRLNLDQLVQLSLITERYGMEKYVAAHVDAWLQPYRARLRAPGWEPWLFLLYQFGLEKDYLMLARHLVLTCGLNVNGALVSSDDCLLNEPLPPGGLNIIRKFRMKVLNRIYGVINDVLFELQNTNHCSVRSCSPEEATLCTAAKKLRLERYISVSGIAEGMRQPWRMTFSPRQIHSMLRESTMEPVSIPPGFESEVMFFSLLGEDNDHEGEGEPVATPSSRRREILNMPSWRDKGGADKGKGREVKFEEMETVNRFYLRRKEAAAPSQSGPSQSGLSEQNKPMHVRHAELHSKCSLGPMLLARIEDLSKVTSMGLAADAQTMDEIRANAIRYGRTPDESYDRRLLWRSWEGMSDWHPGVISSGRVQSGAYGYVGSVGREAVRGEGLERDLMGLSLGSEERDY